MLKAASQSRLEQKKRPPKGGRLPRKFCSKNRSTYNPGSSDLTELMC